MALVGASQGASEVLIAGTLPPPGVTGVVALSADELTIPLASAPYPATAVAAAARLRLPVLLAVAQSDPEVSVPATRRLFTRTGSGRKHLVVLRAQAGHSWDMVRPPLGRQSVPEVQPDRLGVPARPDVMTIVRRVAAALAGLALITGCGASRQATDKAATPPISATPGGASTGSPAATPAAELDNCFGPGRGRVGPCPTPAAGGLTVGVIGTGSRLVLLANESDEDLCSWLPFAARLAASAYRAVVWDYGGSAPAGEIAGLVRTLRADGARRVVLMGASEGAKASLIAGSEVSRRSRASYRCRPRPFFLPASWC